MANRNRIKPPNPQLMPRANGTKPGSPYYRNAKRYRHVKDKPSQSPLKPLVLALLLVLGVVLFVYGVVG